ncbi:MAG: FecR domain-containing protein [Candidatus Cloacimonetes bacterium]|nr:FecR domain-containing protein [Candidatus Cloacimonadota bacterium]
MECNKFDELIQLSLDHSLSNEQKILFDGHVDFCSRCRQELEGYQKLMNMFVDEASIELPTDFTSKVMSKLPEVQFKSKPEDFGFGFEKLMKYKKYISMAVASVVMIAALNFNSPIVSNDTKAGVDTSGAITVAKKIDQNLGGDNSGEDSKVKPKKQIDLNDNVMLTKLALFVDGGVAQIKTTAGFQIVNKGEFYELDFRDEIRTGANTVARIVYPEDKIRLNLKPNTHMQIAQNSVRLHQGHTWVNVVKKGTRFEVRTPNLIAAVRGTMFAVKATKGKESSVSVFEGIVRVNAIDDFEKYHDVIENEEISSTKFGLTAKRKVDDGIVDDWRERLVANELISTTPNSVDKLDLNTEVSPTDSIHTEFGK